MIFRAGRLGVRGRLLVPLSVWLVGCGSPIPPPNRVAEIDDRAISYVAFETFLRSNSVEGAGVLGSDVLSSLLDQFLDEELLARLAFDSLGLSGEADAAMAIQSLLESAIEVPDEESVAEFYEQNLRQFDLPERLHLRQLLFTDRVTAEQVRDSWSQGLAYDGVIERLADDPAAHVGEEGAFSRRELPPVFADALFALGDGQISEVVPVDYGFHVFQVVRHLDAGVAPLEEVSLSIREELLRRRGERVLDQLVAEARERYNVQVFERNLPFNYRGQYGSDRTHETS